MNSPPQMRRGGAFSARVVMIRGGAVSAEWRYFEILFIGGDA